MKKLKCPIRGELKVPEKSKDGVNYTEEYQRIELIRILLELGYKKEDIKIEKIVQKLGNAGRNNLRADVIVMDGSKTKIVAEVKRNSKNKSDAIEFQLLPAMNVTNAEYGVYYDGIENELILASDKETHPLTKLPRFGMKFGQKQVMFDDLRPIENPESLFTLLEQSMHNMGISKEKRYSEVFKIIVAKYIDEEESKFGGVCEFNSGPNSDVVINGLWKKAVSLYGTNEARFYNKSKIGFKKSEIQAVAKLLEDKTFMESSASTMQSFFMKFGSAMLKKDMDQFYTPIEVSCFMASVLEKKSTNKIIDPAGGSADFLTAYLRSFNDKFPDSNGRLKNVLHYQDNSKEAAQVAFINLMLSGGGDATINVGDSIKNHTSQNGTFEFVLTNPPFGIDTKWKGDKSVMKAYDLANINDKVIMQELGILFVERSIKLLKEGGVLGIIIPSSYLQLPKYKFVREYLMSKGEVLGVVGLPDGSFKGAGTGVGTQIMYFKKTSKPRKEYDVFMSNVNEIGFNYKSKSLDKKYIRDIETGEFITDEENKKIINNDLLTTTEEFKQFAYDQNIDGFEKLNSSTNYDSVSITKIKEDQNLIFSPMRHVGKYIDFINKCNHIENFRLNDVKHTITNSKSFDSKVSDTYSYVDIGNLSTGGYYLTNIMRGWQLPGRAKQSVVKGDILLAKLSGSTNKFCMIFEDDSKSIVATNGVFKINIDSHRHKMSFYNFLFSDDFKLQVQSLALGSIMSEIKPEDLASKIIIPLLSEEAVQKVEEMLKTQADLHARLQSLVKSL